MLSLRTAIRSRSRLGLNVISVHTRSYRPTPRCFYQPVVQPYTWQARLWYRPDGIPRSKWKGAFYVTAACSLLLVYQSLAEAIDQIYLLSFLIQVQRVDTKYSLYDLSNAEDLLALLSQVVKCVPDELDNRDIDQFTQAVQQLMKISPELQGYIREQLEELHKVITQDPDQPPLDTAEAALETLRNLSEHLMEVWQKAEGVTIGLKDQKPDDGETYGVVG